MSRNTEKEAASVALSLLDLTNLKDDCTDSQIEALCARAQTRYGMAAAICIWPRFVAQARTVLGKGHRVRIATVVNFPSGNMEVEDVAAETREAIADGADEIDLVIPYRQLMAGDEQAVITMVAAIRAECVEPVVLKVIVETGELREPALIKKASELAIEAGADFIKTSTGKVAQNATLEAADIMLRAIRHSGRKVGFKPAGGIGTVSDAVLYLRLAETIMTPDWAIPSTFRFGASGLLDDILNILSGTQSATTKASGY